MLSQKYAYGFLLWEISHEGDSTISLNSLFCSPTVLTVMRFFPEILFILEYLLNLGGILLLEAPEYRYLGFHITSMTIAVWWEDLKC